MILSGKNQRVDFDQRSIRAVIGLVQALQKIPCFFHRCFRDADLAGNVVSILDG